MPRIAYDEIAAEYARHRRVHPGVLSALCETLVPHSYVLEVGCGTGNTIGAIRSIVGCACRGVDPSIEMLAYAREQHPEVCFAVGAGEHLGQAEEMFDLVFSVDVIHHMQDRRAYWQQAARALKRGGRVCTATDSEWIIRHREPLATYFPESVEIELSRYPRITDLRREMEEAGLTGVNERLVEQHSVLTDAQAYREKAFSILHLLPEAALQRGIERMERDLLEGPLPLVSRYTMLWGGRPEKAEGGR